jgi:hypothetical protein
LFANQLAAGALFIEGTCCSSGSVLVAHVMRKRSRGLERWGLAFYTDFSRGFAPSMFRDRLPRDLRAHCGRGAALYAMFQGWTELWQEQRRREHDPRACFAGTARVLAEFQPGQWRTDHCRDGLLLWTPRGGVPDPAGKA